MGKDSKIGWTNHTFNSWLGCTKVSPGCAKCYAEKQHKRMPFGNLWGPSAERRRTSSAYWQQLLKWDSAAEKAGERHRVFCGSMCDVMEDRDNLSEGRRELYSLICQTPNLDWLLLTKRPENFPRFLHPAWLEKPMPNVWLMTTVENADYVWRAGCLREVPAVVRGLSVEPLLGPLPNLRLDGIHWVIVGAESGHGARPMDEDWVRKIRDQCVGAGVKFFYKQKIVNGCKVELPELDGRVWDELPETPHA